MLHVTCDVIGIAQYHFLKSKMAAMYFALHDKPQLKNFARRRGSTWRWVAVSRSVV